MKKILWMAVAAVLFMACDGSKNGAEMPEKDKQVVDKVTSGMVAQIGKKQADVEAYLDQAGFIKVGEEQEIAPKHLQRKHRAPAEVEASSVQVTYVYGITKEEYAMSDQAAIAARQNEILKKGNAIVIVYAMYQNDKLMMVESSVAVAANKKANTFYTGISDKYYDALPSTAQSISWQGATGAKRDKLYDKHDEYVAEIAAAESITATEMGVAVLDASTYLGYGYLVNFQNPDEDEKAEQAKSGYDPFVTIASASLDLLVVIAMMQN